MTKDRGPIGKLWAQAQANPGTPVLASDVVVCDWCDDDYTNRADQGGFIFQSKATCPKCAPQFEADATKFGEQRYIRARCPDGMSFADFVRAYRGPDAAIKVSVGPPRR